MPPSAFKPPRATLRAEHRNRSATFSSDSAKVGLTSGVSLHRGTFLATSCVLRPPQIVASGPPMPVALRATTIVAALGTVASCVPPRP